MFTGLFESKAAGEYPYMHLGGEPAEEGEISRGRPPAERIRDEVAYEELPYDARLRILEAYRGMWGLEG